MRLEHMGHCLEENITEFLDILQDTELRLCVGLYIF